jgi:drug/metabolite transporter (DMT)-like permease
MNHSVRGEYLILLAAAVWGVAFYFQKTAMLHVGPLLFLGLRAAIAALAILPFALREQRAPGFSVSRVLPSASLGGLLFFSAGAIQQAGIVTATVINTGLLTALYVVVTPFAYWLIERQSPSYAVWWSVVTAFLGVWLLGGGSFGEFSQGDRLIALSAIGWGILIVLIGRAGRLARPATYTSLQFCFVALASLGLASLLEPISLQSILDAADSILYVGLLSTALTFGIMAVALQHVAPPRATVLLSTEVLFSSAAGYFLLGERLSVLGWVGAALILAAVLLVRLRPS